MNLTPQQAADLLLLEFQLERDIRQAAFRREDREYADMLDRVQSSMNCALDPETGAQSTAAPSLTDPSDAAVANIPSEEHSA